MQIIHNVWEPALFRYMVCVYLAHILTLQTFHDKALNDRLQNKQPRATITCNSTPGSWSDTNQINSLYDFRTFTQRNAHCATTTDQSSILYV